MSLFAPPPGPSTGIPTFLLSHSSTMSARSKQLVQTTFDAVNLLISREKLHCYVECFTNVESVPITMYVVKKLVVREPFSLLKIFPGSIVTISKVDCTSSSTVVEEESGHKHSTSNVRTTKVGSRNLLGIIYHGLDILP